MAQPTNTYDSYDQVGIREDLSDIINNVDPDETPFYSSIAKTTASNTYHEWQTDILRASAVNAHIEGDDTVATARTPTVRLGNYTQIFKDAISVSGTDTALDKAGRGDEMDYQIVKTGKEIRLDMEKAFLDNQARVVGSSAAARRLAGVPAWINTNTLQGTGGSDGDPAGDGTDARTDRTQVAFSQARLDSCLQSVWENSNGTNNLTVMLNAFQMNVALGFTGNNNQRATVPATNNRVVNVVDVYMTPWGVVDFVMSREMRPRDILALDMSMWECAVARPMQTEDLAKTGDNDKKQVVGECTLVSRNEKSSGGVFDNTTS